MSQFRRPDQSNQFATEITEITERLIGNSDEDPLTRKIIGAAIEVHRVLGPGLLESIYEEALCHELELCGLEFARQVDVDVVYKGKIIKGQRIDVLVEGEVVTELKSVSRLHEVVKAQVLSYLKATGLKRALLLNFGERRLVDGVTRISL
jgi:GxxExxY protein